MRNRSRRILETDDIVLAGDGIRCDAVRGVTGRTERGDERVGAGVHDIDLRACCGDIQTAVHRIELRGAGSRRQRDGRRDHRSCQIDDEHRGADHIGNALYGIDQERCSPRKLPNGYRLHHGFACAVQNEKVAAEIIEDEDLIRGGIDGEAVDVEVGRHSRQKRRHIGRAIDGIKEVGAVGNIDFVGGGIDDHSLRIVPRKRNRRYPGRIFRGAVGPGGRLTFVHRV